MIVFLNLHQLKVVLQLSEVSPEYTYTMYTHTVKSKRPFNTGCLRVSGRVKVPGPSAESPSLGTGGLGVCTLNKFPRRLGCTPRVWELTIS